jgi:hypothetical protein
LIKVKAAGHARVMLRAWEVPMMLRQLIEVAPQECGWTVTLRSGVRAVFSASAEAVTFAQRLSDELEQRGEHPRIRVHFSPTPATLAP